MVKALVKIGEGYRHDIFINVSKICVFSLMIWITNLLLDREVI